MKKTLKLNAKFYSEEALVGAIKDYEALGDISYKKMRGFLVVDFSNPARDIAEQITDEFGNYILAQVIKNR